MVRALLDGRKVQTRRPVKPQPAPFKNWKGWIVESSNRKHEGCASWADGEEGSLRFNPVYAMPPCKVGDLIYVRETFRLLDSNDQCDCEYPCNHPQQGYPVYFASIRFARTTQPQRCHANRREKGLTHSGRGEYSVLGPIEAVMGEPTDTLASIPPLSLAALAAVSLAGR